MLVLGQPQTSRRCRVIESVCVHCLCKVGARSTLPTMFTGAAVDMTAPCILQRTALGVGCLLPAPQDPWPCCGGAVSHLPLRRHPPAPDRSVLSCLLRGLQGSLALQPRQPEPSVSAGHTLSAPGLRALAQERLASLVWPLQGPGQALRGSGGWQTQCQNQSPGLGLRSRLRSLSLSLLSCAEERRAPRCQLAGLCGSGLGVGPGSGLSDDQGCGSLCDR